MSLNTHKKCNKTDEDTLTGIFIRFKALTKPALCQTLKNPARQGSKLAAKGAYIDVSDRRLQAHLTQQAKNPSALLLSEGIFAFAGVAGGLADEDTLPGIFIRLFNRLQFNIPTTTGNACPQIIF